MLSDRENATHQWSTTDDEHNYSLINGDNRKNYLKADINYIYNSNGFRSDELSAPSDVEILFMGCSFTEGIGLPIAEIWPTLLLTKLRSLPQFKDNRIPYKTISVGGAGIDNQTRLLHKYIDKVKPKYIFFGYPHLYRREYSFNGKIGINWVPNFRSTNHPRQIEEVLVDDSYAIAATYRGFLLLDALSQKYNTKVFVIQHSTNPDATRIQQLIEQVGGNLRSILILNNKEDRRLFDAYAYNRAIHAPTYARDNLHPGALWQYKFASMAWETIKLEFAETIEHKLLHQGLVQNKQVTK